MHIPTAQEQLKFLKNIQLILQSGSFSSTYKFALLISLSRLAIEKGEDSGESLSLEYTDIAEKFIELYWKQAVPYTFNDEGQLILNQNNGKQAAIVNRIIQLRQSYSSLGLLRRDSLVWLKLVKDVARTVKDMPVRYLQNINGQNFEFLYQLDRCGKQLILLNKIQHIGQTANLFKGITDEAQFTGFLAQSHSVKLHHSLLPLYLSCASDFSVHTASIPRAR